MSDHILPVQKQRVVVARLKLLPYQRKWAEDAARRDFVIDGRLVRATKLVRSSLTRADAPPG